MVYSYNEILLSSKKEWNSDTYNMYESQNNYAKWKKTIKIPTV